MTRGGKGTSAQEALEQLKATSLPKGLGRSIGVAIGALALAAAATNSLYSVQGGFRAVKFNLVTGMYPQTWGPGTHLRIPGLERVIQFDIRQQPISITSSQGSRDLQIVNTSVRVLFQANEENLTELYRRLGLQYADVVLPSIANEVLKSVIAQFNASELITKRPEVSAQITAELRNRASDFFIDISDVSITQMNFGKEYTNAVEAKQIAQQLAEQARFKVEQAQQEKKGAIILAEGEAESAKLIGRAMQENPAFLELRRIEAAKSIAGSIAKSPNRALLDSDNLLFNLMDSIGAKKA